LSLYKSAHVSEYVGIPKEKVADVPGVGVNEHVLNIFTNQRELGPGIGPLGKGDRGQGESIYSSPIPLTADETSTEDFLRGQKTKD
jgi:hypothetical protein